MGQSKKEAGMLTTLQTLPYPRVSMKTGWDTAVDWQQAQHSGGLMIECV
jgi:hypothetical protein